MLKATMKKDWGRLLLAVLGSLIYALGVNIFMVPLGLYTGGLLGLGQLIRTMVVNTLGVTPPIDLAGVILYIFNIPLLVVAYRIMGRLFFRNTLICSTTYALFAALVPVPVAPVVDDMLTGCLLGGVISGVGTGLVLTCGCCGGGLDVLAMYLAHKKRRVSVGQFNLAVNAVLFVLCGILFDLPTMIYSILSTVFQSFALDKAYQQGVDTQMLIFTKADARELDEFIFQNLHRGITRWDGIGVYTGETTHVMCVCLSKYETRELQQKLREFDPNVFFIIQEGVRMSSNFERHLC